MLGIQGCFNLERKCEIAINRWNWRFVELVEKLKYCKQELG